MGKNNQKKSSGIGSLRMEAKPFSLKELNKKQIEAFDEILQGEKTGCHGICPHDSQFSKLFESGSRY